MRTAEQLRDELTQVLSALPLDNGRLIELTRQLTSLDPDTVRFSIDAGLIDRLGRELVARQETAVSELVKNAYDADATDVTLSFIDANETGGTLNIQDDGDGMTRDELINGFMRISSTSKVHEPLSRAYKRQRAGQKGIGRFAVQRLGRKLTVVTQTAEATQALKLVINWDSYKADTDIFSISNSVTTIAKFKEKGTLLIVEGLRDKWTEAAIQRIYRYVSDIIQPFPISKQYTNNEIDPGFAARFVQTVEGRSKTLVDERIMVHDHALAVIDGRIDEYGHGSYTIRSPRVELDESITYPIGNHPSNGAEPFTAIRNVHFRAYYFLYVDDLLPKSLKASIQNLARKQGGIRLYRNGFRVLPYGEVGDDWLKLDQSMRERTILPSHGNNNFFGFVELADSENLFNETSSREGLTESQGFIQLRNFLYRALVSAILKVNERRGIKLTANQQRDEHKQWESVEVSIKNVAHAIEELDAELERDGGTIQARRKRRRRISEAKKALLELAKKQREVEKRLIKETSMLRVLSSVGLTIGQFIHEIKYYMDNVQSDIDYIAKRLANDQSGVERAGILGQNFASFKTYTSYFDKVVSQNVIRSIYPLNLAHVVTPFVHALTQDAKKSGITFLPPVYSKPFLMTKAMHPSEWSSILFNFYTNSKKAIKRAGVEGAILIECGENEGLVYLEFSDNGDGISKENEERVFDEFFTTTSGQSLEDFATSTEILGTGLGLKIVKDIIKSHRGNVMVVSPKAHFATTIRVEIPKATEKELEQHEQ